MKPTSDRLTEIPPLNTKQPVNFVGKFNVIHSSNVMKFTILDLALKYYNELYEEATLWDVTNEAELIRFKCILKDQGSME